MTDKKLTKTEIINELDGPIRTQINESSIPYIDAAIAYLRERKSNQVRWVKINNKKKINRF